MANFLTTTIKPIQNLPKGFIFSGKVSSHFVCKCVKCNELYYINENGKPQVNRREIEKCPNCVYSETNQVIW